MTRLGPSRRAAAGGLLLVLAAPAVAWAARPRSRSLEKDPSVMPIPRTATGEAEMAAARGLTTRVLAIGRWTEKAPPEARPPVMPHEARDTLRLMLMGKIDQWFAKSDGSGTVFLLNVPTPAEAHALLEDLPLGRAQMMVFDLIPVGPLWPLGLMLSEPGQ